MVLKKKTPPQEKVLKVNYHLTLQKYQKKSLKNEDEFTKDILKLVKYQVLAMNTTNEEIDARI